MDYSFDSPQASTDDDYCIITVKLHVPEIIVATFEVSYENHYVRVVYHRKDGLDGKVSRIHID